MPKMTAKDTNYTLGEESIWLTHTLGNYLDFQLYHLGLLVTLLTILYCPIVLGLSVIYMSAFFLYICKKIGNLPEDPDNKRWRTAQQINAFGISMLGKLLHGLATGLTAQGCGHPNREECVAILKKGHLLGIAPGGLREQNYGDNTYKLIWGNREGFAHIAIKAKVPVIPVFTQNIREAYRVYGNIGPMRWLYERTRLLFFPICGPFPVKLRTHIGEPIPYDPNITTDELFEKAKLAMEELRDKHQKIPGSILSALWERFGVHRKEE